MTFYVRTVGLMPLGVSYFIAVFACLTLTQQGHGSPYLWFPSAILIAGLAGKPPAKWPDRLFACLLASIFASAITTGEWNRSVLLSLAGLAEAAVGAALLRRRTWTQAPGTVAWMVRSSLSIGLAAPLVGALIVASVSDPSQEQIQTVFLSVFIAHSLGNLAFEPLLRMLFRRGWTAFVAGLGQHGATSTAALFGLVTIVTFGVFYQTELPLLFIPMLPVVLACFRMGYGGAAVSVLIVAIVGGALTASGHGPMQLIHGPLSARFLFFMFFLAALSLVSLPIAAELESRADMLRVSQVNEARSRLFAEYSTDIMMHIDEAGSILYASPAIDRFMEVDFMGRTGEVATFIEPEDLPLVRQGHANTLAACGETVSFEYRAITQSGERRWLEAHARAIVPDDGSASSVITVLRDITDRKALEERLAREALTDPLTGLANRRGFGAAVDHCLANRIKGQTDCVAVFDIDHFKSVNDRHGHDAGDAVLQVFSRVLRHVVRESDVIARVGGEEFAALFPATSVDETFAICERLRSEMSRQTTITGTEPIRVTVSGGVAPFTHTNLERALKDADIALYEAKRRGRNQMTLAA